MLNFIHDDWHGWQGAGAFLLSDEKVKHLRSFADADAAITWLYLEGYRDAARKLNAVQRGARKS
jgi:hypothetical protein